MLIGDWMVWSLGNHRLGNSELKNMLIHRLILAVVQINNNYNRRSENSMCLHKQNGFDFLRIL